MKANCTILVLLVNLILKADCQCTHGDVHLVGGAGDYEGNVQVCVNSTWGHVCDDGWGSNEAEVVCLQLGYSASNTVHWFASRYGYGDVDVTIWLSKLQCTGSEAKLIDCPKGAETGATFCDRNQIAGVVCQKGGPGCSTGDIRLANSHNTNNNYYGRSEGRVEVCYNNTWGTVCRDGWGTVDATVACKQLGYTASISYYTYTYYGAGTGPIWLDDLYYCSTGTESSLFDCTNGPIGSHNCDHSEDAGVRCYAIDVSNCTNGDIKLWSAHNTTAVNEGIVLVCKSGTWYPLHQSSNCRVAEIACNASGYSDVQYIRSNAGEYYGYYYTTHYQYTCSKEDNLLSECLETSYSNSYYTSTLGVVCTNKTVVISGCTNGDIRLANSGLETEGRVEYCFNEQWTPFCSLSLITADLICKQLGYSKDSGSEIVRNNQYGRSETTSSFQYLSCSTFSSDLSQCSMTKTCVPTSCPVQFGLKCNESCLHGDLRLIGGSNTYEGNVQVCVNGTWGYVCDNSWSSNDASVVCRQLGYSVLFATTRQNSYYGYGTGTIWFDYVACTGTESQLIDCPTGSLNSNCKHNQLAGVSCPFGGASNCSDGEIRLISFYASPSYGQSSGRLEYCHNGEWGTVCDNNWQNADTDVVCRQLGYNGNENYYSNAYYGSGTGSVWLDNVQCSGDESTLQSCLASTNGDNSCAHDDDVGMQCYSTKTSSCNDGDITLWSAYGLSPDNEGIALICKSGTWYAVYGSGSCYLADILCKKAGYSNFEFYRASSGYYYGLYDKGHYQYTCLENAVTLSDCIEKKYSFTTSYSLSLRCQLSSGLNCTVEGAVRLVGGEADAEGRVEYCYNGEWAPMCSLSSYTGSLICSEMGYTIPGSLIITDERYGRMHGYSKFQSLSCSVNSDVSISDCSLSESSCSSSDCSTQYGLKCYDEKASCTDGDIRLWSIHESTPDNEGLILVCKNGIWYPMYGSSSCRASEIVCNTLGYSDVEYIQANGQTYYGDFYQKRYRYSCSNSYTSLSQCSETEYSISNSYLLGVKCHIPSGSNCTSNSTNGDIRLVGGATAGEGRLEYCFHGEWAPMCSLPDYTSTLICQELGYNQGSLIISDQRYGRSDVTGNIFNYLSCSIGSDHNISDCSINVIRCSNGPPNSCSLHYGVKCYGEQTCTDGEVTLWSADNSTPDNEGLVIVCNNGKWYPVYGFSGCRTAELACYEAGYLSLEGSTYLSSSEYGYYYQTHHYYSCQSDDNTISECSYSTTTSWYYSLGAQCSPEPVNCTNGDVRLMGGDSDAEGRVEYCYNGQWSPMCSLNDYTGSLVCKALGYNQGSYVINDERYNRLNVSRRFQSISCSIYSQFSLSECSSISRQSCTQNPVSCSLQYGLKCFGDKSPCTNGNITLWSHHDSTPNNEGIPLLCKNGVWYPIYDNSNCRAAEIICNTAGYQELESTSNADATYGYYYESHYGYSCSDSDSSLATCSESYQNLYNSFDDSLGVKCQDNSGLNCSVEGAVRLVGGATEAEGRVEYCYNGKWAPMCSLSGYTGSLICNEMGYEEGSLVISDERYGRLSGYSKFQSLSCSIGSDTSLSQCSVSQRSCSQGATTCSTQYGLKCFGSKTACTNGDVKLWSAYDTTAANRGILLVCKTGTWYPVHEYSGCRAAEIACNEAGYSTLDLYTSDGGNTYGYYYKAHYRYSCSNNDITLSDCSQSYYSLSSSWDDSLSVRCELGGLNCTNGDLRLMGGESDAEGRVEYCYNGQWSPMCSLDGYTSTLICKELGYTQGGLSISDERYGRLDVSRKFQYLSCLYSHNTISQCSVAKKSCFQGPSSCSIQNGLKCFGGKSPCTHGHITLWSAYDTTPDNEGIILVCKNDTWYPVYDTSDCRAGEIACKAAGYPNLESYKVVGGSYYGNYYETAYKYTCSETSQTLSDCGEISYSLSSNTGSWYRSLGVQCQPISDQICSTEGAVRLVGGESDAEGRVEYCYNGEWAPMCSLDGYAGSLVCQYLGYSKWSVSVAGEMFNRTNVKSKFQYLSCSSSHANISECTVIERTCITGSCSTQYGLRCYNPDSDCNDGDVRLVDGVIEQEGRPEVCINRVWGSICDSGWSLNDAYVMCLSLGYIGSADPIAHYNSKFGLGSVPVVWSNVNCNHWNKDIHDCPRTDYPGFICTTSDVAGIRCTEGCSDGDIRLVGGSNVNEGTVEICYNELWGLVSDDGWSDSDAMVVCQQLGVNISGVPVTNSYYGKPNKTVHLMSVQCSGDESMLSQCSFTQLSLEDGVMVRPNISVAGAKCIGSNHGGPSDTVRTGSASAGGSANSDLSPSRSTTRGGVTESGSSSVGVRSTAGADRSTGGTNSTTIMIGGVVVVVIVLVINFVFFAVVIVIVRCRNKNKYDVSSSHQLTTLPASDDSKTDVFMKSTVYDNNDADDLYEDMSGQRGPAVSNPVYYEAPVNTLKTDSVYDN